MKLARTYLTRDIQVTFLLYDTCCFQYELETYRGRNPSLIAIKKFYGPFGRTSQAFSLNDTLYPGASTIFENLIGPLHNNNDSICFEKFKNNIKLHKRLPHISKMWL